MAEPNTARPITPFTQPINAEAQRLAAEPPKPVVKIEGTRATPSTNQADMSPQERWLSDKAAGDRADPWRNPDVALIRDPKTGQIVQHEKTIDANGETVAGKRVDEQPGTDEGSGAAAEGEGNKVKIGEIEVTEKEIRELMEAKAADDLKKATVPASPAEYKIELPRDLKLPAGAEFKLASADDPVKGPAIRAAQDWAHRNKLTQNQFGELLGLYGAAQSAEQIAAGNAARAEREALGATGPARVDAISQWLRGRYGDAVARPILATLLTRHHVAVFENIITQFTNNGGGSFRQIGREIETGKVDDDAYSKMTYGEKLDYARNMTARAQSNGRR